MEGARGGGGQGEHVKGGEVAHVVRLQRVLVRDVPRAQRHQRRLEQRVGELDGCQPPARRRAPSAAAARRQMPIQLTDNTAAWILPDFPFSFYNTYIHVERVSIFSERTAASAVSNAVSGAVSSAWPHAAARGRAARGRAGEGERAHTPGRRPSGCAARVPAPSPRAAPPPSPALPARPRRPPRPLAPPRTLRLRSQPRLRAHAPAPPLAASAPRAAGAAGRGGRRGATRPKPRSGPRGRARPVACSVHCSVTFSLLALGRERIVHGAQTPKGGGGDKRGTPRRARAGGAWRRGRR